MNTPSEQTVAEACGREPSAMAIMNKQDHQIRIIPHGSVHGAASGYCSVLNRLDETIHTGTEADCEQYVTRLLQMLGIAKVFDKQVGRVTDGRREQSRSTTTKKANRQMNQNTKHIAGSLFCAGIAGACLTLLVVLAAVMSQTAKVASATTTTTKQQLPQATAMPVVERWVPITARPNVAETKAQPKPAVEKNDCMVLATEMLGRVKQSAV
jgi:hypothetical protein